MQFFDFGRWSVMTWRSDQPIGVGLHWMRRVGRGRDRRSGLELCVGRRSVAVAALLSRADHAAHKRHRRRTAGGR
jgi:hypothetical protein